MRTESLEIINIPFNQLLKLEKSDKDDFIYMLNERNDLHNHLNTFHAGVLFSVAESTGGEFLLKTFGHKKMDIIPVIRSAEIKYSKPGQGKIYSTATLISPNPEEAEHALNIKKKVMIRVRSDIYNEENKRLLTAFFDWFVVVK